MFPPFGGMKMFLNLSSSFMASVMWSIQPSGAKLCAPSAPVKFASPVSISPMTIPNCNLMVCVVVLKFSLTGMFLGNTL